MGGDRGREGVMPPTLLEIMFCCMFSWKVSQGAKESAMYSLSTIEMFMRMHLTHNVLLTLSERHQILGVLAR